MPMTITGVPTSIQRSEYLRMIESLGIRADDVISLKFGAKSITAEVFARNEDGHRYAIRIDGEAKAAIHHITIEVVEDDE